MEISPTKSKVLLVASLALFLVLGSIYVFLRNSGTGLYKPPVQENKTGQSTDAAKETAATNDAPAKLPGVEFQAYPADFPKDLAIFPGTFEQSLRYVNPQGVEVISITYVTPGEVKAAVDMYKSLLTQAKWNIDEKTVGKGELLTVSKDKMRAEITFDPMDKNSSKVHLLYYLPK